MIKEASDKYSFYANQRRREHDPNDYQPGTLVMVNRRNIGSIRPTAKFDDRLIGPFPILSAVGTHAYRLDLGQRKVHNVFHVDLLRFYKPPSTVPARKVHDHPPAEVPEEDAYVVEKILDSRIRCRRLEYHVRWKGWETEHDSWVKHTEFHDDDSLVLDFQQEHPNRPTLAQVPPTPKPKKKPSKPKVKKPAKRS
jgi:hypothetical protein